jgi:predicted membrane-bound spermidine synthase
VAGFLFLKARVFVAAGSITPQAPLLPLKAPTHWAFAALLVFASGAAGLVWQIVWTAKFSLALGHEIIAVLSVMAAFFGGISAGSLLLAHRLERSAHPGRWYAGLEALISGWALLVAFVSPFALPQLLQRQTCRRST